MDRAFAPLGAAGLAATNVQPAQTVLDIGCGSGATLIALATAVGAAGYVVGVDVSASMLEVAERRAAALGLTNLRCILADASTYPFGEDSFDLAFSRFGVMFFDDPVAAFANVRRSLRPEGRVVFVCWRDLLANPWFRVPAEAVRAHVAPQPQPDPETPGPLAFADPDRVRRILEQAGFQGVQFEAFDAKLPLGSRTSATELLTHIGPAARLIGKADAKARAAAGIALDHALKTHEADGEVYLGAGVWIVSAHDAARR
jgi:SAM-dependent methyltransferase